MVTQEHTAHSKTGTVPLWDAPGRAIGGTSRKPNHGKMGIPILSENQIVHILYARRS